MRFDELQVIVSTALLLPALIALIRYGMKHRGHEETFASWDPRLSPERDWWTKEPRP